MQRARTRNLAWTGAVWMLLAAVHGVSRAQGLPGEFHLFPEDGSASAAFFSSPAAASPAAFALAVADAEEFSARVRVGPGALSLASAEAEAQAPPPTLSSSAASATPGKLFSTPTTLVTAGALVLGSIYGLSGGWKYGFDKFHFTDEGWFSPNTYAGGADKCSHFVVSSGMARLLFDVYEAQGHSPDQSFALAFGTSILTGFLVEMGDGITVYGFSVQDLGADVLGTAAGLLINRNGMKDLLGIRLGKVPTEVPDALVGSRDASLGTGYSNEIYTADLKFAGLARRLQIKPGIARYFMVSAVYFTKGFGYKPPLPERHKDAGFEIGLNLPEILEAVGVQETTWWGNALLKATHFFRLPFTSIGIYYDMSRRTWFGPGAADTFR